MAKPVVGVIGNVHVVENRFPAQMVGERNLRAVAEVAGALPLMFAGRPDVTDIDALLGVVDGILLYGRPRDVTGSPRPRSAPAARTLRQRAR